MILRGPQSTWPPAPSAPERQAPALGGGARALPSLAQLTYAKEFITVALLLLALPWLATKLVTRPGEVLAGVARARGGA